MKKLFGDGAIAKLRAIPAWLWVVAEWLAIYFANLYTLLVNSEQMAAETKRTLLDAANEGVELVEVNEVALGILLSALSALFILAAVELLTGLAHNVARNKFGCGISRADFKFRVRHFVILTHLAIGVLSIGYFFTNVKNGAAVPLIKLFDGTPLLSDGYENPYFQIQSSVLPFLATVVAFAPFYDDFRARYAPPRAQAPLFREFATIFIGIHVGLYVARLIFSTVLVRDGGLDAISIATDALNAVVYAATGIACYFRHKKIKKENEIDRLKPNIGDMPASGDDIFGDLGF